ncbi:DUF2550 domain-containing protein [Gandjariella thermophila]|uniref:DUF2550 domain-containing protein n=1 Tax=Gandjariella thermophila TaxID=1931992 RepID=A0A4D4J724_9PSEU|nr:DUF2550 domain-containing protein [Gandjariella thermophila]GDY32441.1 hypothetical protein GTS_40740 [Gandjariella thermophila]
MAITGWVVVLLLLVVVAGTLTLRRWLAIREGVPVALRQRLEGTGRGWHLGIAHYRGGDFLWYRVLGVSTRPDRVIRRSGLEIAARREPDATESYAMPRGATVLRCRADAGDIELAMGADTLTGFLSWLESAPPGRAVPWAS